MLFVKTGMPMTLHEDKISKPNRKKHRFLLLRENILQCYLMLKSGVRRLKKRFHEYQFELMLRSLCIYYPRLLPGS